VKKVSPTRFVFAANLKRERLQAGLSQEELAELAELDRTYISSLERSKYNVTIDNIYRLAVALDMKPYELLMPEDFDAAAN